MGITMWAVAGVLVWVVARMMNGYHIGLYYRTNPIFTFFAWAGFVTFLVNGFRLINTYLP